MRQKLRRLAEQAREYATKSQQIERGKQRLREELEAVASAFGFKVTPVSLNGVEQGEFKCKYCPRTFTYKMHEARHRQSHGKKKAHRAVAAA